MANSTALDNFSIIITSLVQGFRDDLLHPIGFLQIGAIGVTFLIAWLFATLTILKDSAQPAVKDSLEVTGD